VANALDRWDEEGGAPAVPWPLPYETGDLLDAERRVLECLGAALVSEWNGLPTDVQRRLFEHAASGKSHDVALLKARIARSCTITKTIGLRAKFLRLSALLCMADIGDSSRSPERAAVILPGPWLCAGRRRSAPVPRPEYRLRRRREIGRR
jgi:hypothetical protein